MPERPAITTLLDSMARGDSSAQGKLYVLVYDELKRIARSTIRKSAGSMTVNPSTLVHEAYLKISAGAGRDLNDSNHFYSLLARAMRQVVIDAGRAQATGKHGDGMVRVDLSETLPAQDQSLEHLLSVDQALCALQAVDPQLAELVELHFFAGLAFVDIARLRGVTERTIRRHWDTARAFLLAHMPGAI
jgi:RNA polymerase sigma factor (TIGR02999 family)